MRGLILPTTLTLVVIGCVAERPRTTATDAGKGEWRVAVSEEEFARRYPGLGLDYYRPMQGVERAVKYADGNRTTYEKTGDPAARQKALKYYRKALDDVARIEQETHNSGVLRFIKQRITPHYEALLSAEDRERGRSESGR